jgi:hypothetical protein
MSLNAHWLDLTAPATKAVARADNTRASRTFRICLHIGLSLGGMNHISGIRLSRLAVISISRFISILLINSGCFSEGNSFTGWRLYILLQYISRSPTLPAEFGSRPIIDQAKRTLKFFVRLNGTSSHDLLARAM